jgi:xanthine dehydrogenase accessory factor
VGLRTLFERFDAWRAEGRTLVLATVIETSGSTYSKAGHRILIADSHEWQGLVSGGCLEGDLALQAEQVRHDGQARVVTYDLRGDADGVFGLGVGCDGLLRILLQRLDPGAGWEPMASIVAAVRDGAPATLLTITGAGGGLVAGATLLQAADRQVATGLDDATAGALARILAGPGTRIGAVALPPPFAQASALLTAIDPLPRLLVLGAGPDVAPLVAFARPLDFHVTCTTTGPPARPGPISPLQTVS